MKRIVAATLGLGLGLSEATAEAWVFPEHAEITRFALDRHLPPRARSALAGAVAQVRAPGDYSLPLCRDVSLRVDRAGTHPGCVAFSALPALAGDHAVDADALRRLLVSTLAAKVTRTAGDEFSAFLDHAPLDLARMYRGGPTPEDGPSDQEADAERRTFTRQLDLLLQAVDAGYAGRAGGSKSHFQNAAAPIEVLLKSAKTGDLDNALGQTLAHHMRSLQFAARAMSKLEDPHAKPYDLGVALLEHAFAVHFMQDAFAAGHIGTEPALAGSAARLQRHDYLNRVGLTATHALGTLACHPRDPDEGPDRSESPSDCWIAFGDAYLDDGNAQRVAMATATLEMELALALDPSVATDLIGACQLEPPRTPSFREWKRDLADVDDADASGGPPAAGQCAVQLEGPSIVDVCAYELRKGQHVSVRVESTDFDPFLQVRLPGKFRIENDNRNVLDTASEVTFTARDDGTYLFEVSAASTGQTGSYTLSIRYPEMASANDAGCDRLRQAWGLLDPAPFWAQSEPQRIEREQWSERDESLVAERGMSAASDAVRAVARANLAAKVACDGGSVSQPGGVPDDLLHDPLAPCKNSAPWRDRRHPLCASEGAAFRFGDPDASLWLPILVRWPTAVADLRTERGQDSFGAGLAGQFIFGALANGEWDARVPLGLAPWLGLGISLRADSLFPDRNNRELFGLNGGVGPILLGNVNDTRYALIAFVELRLPLWSALGSWLTGKSWSLGNLDIGPTGFREYFELPSRAPGGDGRHLGWDLELLNYKLSGSSNARLASAGDAMDLELRMRIGSMNLAAIDPNSTDPAAFMIAFELSSGYSVFLLQMQ